MWHVYPGQNPYRILTGSLMIYQDPPRSSKDLIRILAGPDKDNISEDLILRILQGNYRDPQGFSRILILSGSCRILIRIFNRVDI